MNPNSALQNIDQRIHAQDCQCKRCARPHPKDDANDGPDAWAVALCIIIGATSIITNYWLFA